MSATNRNGVERARDDYYITPQKTIKEFLGPFYSQVGHKFELSDKIEILDPCAGGDAKYGMAYPEVLSKEWIDTSITTIDIRQDSRADIKENFLDCVLCGDYDLVVSNPPYNLALEFINKGLEVVKNGGFVAYLLRLNFFGSQKRKEFFKAFMPEYCFIHSERPCFLTKEIIAELRRKAKEDAENEEKRILKEEGRVVKIKPKSVSTTDATEYAHFVWRKGYNPEFCKTIVV